MKKTIKKASCIALNVAMIASLSACGGNSSGNKGNGKADEKLNFVTSNENLLGEVKGDITVLTQRTDLIDTDFADYAKEFEKKYPGTKVNFEAIENYEDDMSIRIQGGEYGDVCMVPTSVASADYESYFENFGTVDELKEQYSETFLYATTLDKTVYGLPSGANAGGVIYNSKVFADAGVTDVPKTADGFIDALKKVKDNTDAIPYYTNYHDSWALSQWEAYLGAVSGSGSYINDDMSNDSTPFDSGKPGYKTYDLLYEIVANGLCEDDPVTSDWEGSKTMINNGEIGCMVMGSWAISQFKEAGDHPDDIAVMPFPVAADDGNIYVGADADYSYGIPTTSKNKPTAYAWVDYMLNESGFADKQGEISIVNGSDLPETLAAFADVEFIVTLPASPENEGKWDAVHNESELNLWSGSEYQLDIIDTALGQSQLGNKNFDDVMKVWNDKWSAALETVNADWDK